MRGALLPAGGRVKGLWVAGEAPMDAIAPKEEVAAAADNAVDGRTEGDLASGVLLHLPLGRVALQEV